MTQRLTRGLLLTSWIFWTANTGLTALLVPFVVDRLGGSGADVGYLITALGIGYLCGSAILKPFLWRPARVSLPLACTATGVCFLLLFNAQTMTVALVAILAAGIPGSMVSVITQYTLQANVPSTLLGRTSAAFYTGDASAAVIGALLAAALSGVVGLAVLLNTFSAAVLFAGLPAIVWRQQTLRDARRRHRGSEDRQRVLAVGDSLGAGDDDGSGLRPSTGAMAKAGGTATASDLLSGKDS